MLKKCMSKVRLSVIDGVSQLGILHDTMIRPYKCNEVDPEAWRGALGRCYIGIGRKRGHLRRHQGHSRGAGSRQGAAMIFTPLDELR